MVGVVVVGRVVLGKWWEEKPEVKLQCEWIHLGWGTIQDYASITEQEEDQIRLTTEKILMAPRFTDFRKGL